jgi:predicted ATPase
MATHPDGAGASTLEHVLGEPGIGKSRLLAEIQEADGHVRWIEGRCLSYGRSLPYHLITDLVTSMTGATGELNVDKVEQLVAAVVDEKVSETTGHLLHLLSLPTPAEISDRLAELDPAAVRRRHVDALMKMLSGMAQSRPIALVCEDLHWADAASVDVLEELAQIVHRCPVLLLGTTRPERESEGWRFVSHARSELGDALTELRLEALSHDDSRSLVANLLEIESLLPEVRRLILERSDGNPFFVEEIIRSLIDDGLITRHGEKWVASGDLTGLDVPETIQGLLLGRIDRLPDDARRALRVASVLGRTFTATLLESVFDEPIDVTAELGTLEAHGLVTIAATRPEISYTFRHALVQEAAYSGLLKRERRELHGRVADVIEVEHRNHPDEITALLSHHLDLAGDHDRALPHMLEAGRQALARYADREARALFARANELLAERTGPEWMRPRVEALVGQSDAGTKWIPVDEGRTLLDAALPEAEKLGDEHLLARIHLGFAELYYAEGDLANPEFHAALEHAQELGERLRDDTFIALPLSLHAQTAAGAGQYREAVASAERAVDILERREVFSRAAPPPGGGGQGPPPGGGVGAGGSLGCPPQG